MSATPVLLAIEASQRRGGVAVRDHDGEDHVEWLGASARHDDDLLADLDIENPGLLDRVSVFGLDDYGSGSWLTPLTTIPFKLRVKQILAIP